MSLRDRLGKTATTQQDRRQQMYERFGIAANPYPPAGEPTGHPHMETEVEEPIVQAIQAFDRDRVSQVFLVEGTQGVGKTNLLNYFQQELQDLYREAEGHYIIRYYPDPESTFDGILRRIFQEFVAHDLLTRLAGSLGHLTKTELDATVGAVSSHEMRAVLHALARAATQPSEDGLRGTIQLALEWLTGLRILKKHREVLGVSFRLDTVESKTQALRDLVFCCSGAQLFHGLYLLLDELEKQDYSFSKTVVLRYLLAIRALIDALPKHLFLLVALTTEARRRYFSMLPAFAGRLQNIVRIDPIKTPEVAVNLSAFYLREARGRAEREIGQDRGKGGKVVDPVPEEEVRRIFGDLLRRAAAEKAQEGVTPRDFLNALYQQAESAIAALG